jgi:predicted 3-demethylubiquinone-9 3-methyltransferase (glyoxalase superfamily)
LLTINLRVGPGNTTVLTLVHERLEDLAGAMPQVADKVGLGWQLVLEKLQTAVTVVRS